MFWRSLTRYRRRTRFFFFVFLILDSRIEIPFYDVRSNWAYLISWKNRKIETKDENKIFLTLFPIVNNHKIRSEFLHRARSHQKECALEERERERKKTECCVLTRLASVKISRYAPSPSSYIHRGKRTDSENRIYLCCDDHHNAISRQQVISFFTI